MNKFLKSTMLSLVAACLSASAAYCCTSMIVSGNLTANGRPMMWKHRDTGAQNNFIASIPATDSTYAYVALYNSGDSLLAEAWTGYNSRGFAIMNTASYNLVHPDKDFQDREGIVMTRALQSCSSVDDFACLLDSLLASPMGVEANFGVLDAYGNGAYFETDNTKYTRYDLVPGKTDYIIRTNYSVSGEEDMGYGYIRYEAAREILKDDIDNRSLTPASFTENASRSFYHSLLDHDFLNDTVRWVVDQDFIPRNISTASIVVEGVNKPTDASDIVMWTMLGYPPCSYVQPVTIGNVPQGLQPDTETWRSPYVDSVLEIKKNVYPISRGSGSHYLDMDYIRKITPVMRAKSLENYSKAITK